MSQDISDAQGFQPLFVQSADGLRLHARDYGGGEGLPVICLPGLRRRAADFDALAQALAGAGRRVLALDYRGRGGSDRDSDWQHYSLPVESGDIQQVLAACGVDRAVFVGTSRGGLHIMLLAAFRPGLVAAAVLNDIGPVIEPEGLAHIRAYLGKVPPLASLADAVAALQATMADDFTGLTDADWAAYARLTFRQPDGSFGPNYDLALAHTMDDVDLDQPLPTLWPQFEALAGAPLLVVRGANSRLFSAATCAEMARRHPGCETFVVAGQGHPPLLLDRPSIARLCSFVATAGGPA
jgi:pimeloyl-ACP methyl ester carboxylesterase